MFEAISDFVDTDLQKQRLLEQSVSANINTKLSGNLLFFKLNYPDIFEKCSMHTFQKYSIFCSKDATVNIVHPATGRVLYPNNFAEMIQTEIDSFLSSAPFVSLDSGEIISRVKPVPNESVILMFGLGLGYQLSLLLRQVKPKVLVIYEPELDIFACSMQAINWEEIFDIAAESQTLISFQLGNAGSSIAEDVAELKSLLPQLNELYLYRHLSHAVSDEVFHFLRECSGNLDRVLKKRQFPGFNDDNLFNSEYPLGVLGNLEHKNFKSNKVFKKNIAALKIYYPSLYSVFISYQPKNWFYVEHNKNPNLYCDVRDTYFYKDVEMQSRHVTNNFLTKPNDNEVVLNQGGVGKFKNYVHFQASAKLQPLLTSLTARNFNENTDIENLIFLGVGLGRHIELLLEKKEIENIFIFEPNVDYFFASLFITDWSKILKDAEKNKRRIYFNIGGTGDEYFQDIMNQYYQIGAYSISKTQIFTAFKTPRMLKALDKLQAQLKVIVALGENFDHVRYGISHTYQSLCNGHNFLKSKNLMPNIHILKDKPIFVVGNGPSLDDSYQYIIEHRENVVVVSCGTALRSLYKLGITPDFHAEIEQNRATYCWITQVNDFKWLKKIKLISVNGIHPETAELFQDVFLAFKDGESSTNFFRNPLQAKGFNFTSLSHSYPTVSNLVVNFFTAIGFRDLYLFGVDLGYLSIENHHSKHSAYYKNDGSGVMNAKANFQCGMRIKGNFSDYVYTKPEFDFSRSIMEMLFAKLPSEINIYNCSNGAYIKGATPLAPYNILTKKITVDEKETFYLKFSELFYRHELSDFTTDFRTQIENIHLNLVVDRVLGCISTANSCVEAKNIIEEQWKTFITHDFNKNRLDFYLLCGSVIYMLSVLKRLAPINEESESYSKELEKFNQAIVIWRDYLKDAENRYSKSKLSFCDVDVTAMFN